MSDPRLERRPLDFPTIDGQIIDPAYLPPHLARDYRARLQAWQDTHAESCWPRWLRDLAEREKPRAPRLPRKHA